MYMNKLKQVSFNYWYEVYFEKKNPIQQIQLL